MYTIDDISEITGIPKPSLNSRIHQRGMKGKCLTKKNTRYFTEEQMKIISAKKITLYSVIKKPKKPYFEFAANEYSIIHSETS